MSVNWFWIVGWFVTVFGLVGNAWVILIIATRKRLQTTANWFILSLAVADFSVTSGYFPASFVCNVKVLKVACNDFIRLNFGYFFMEASMFALIAMIAERYIAIVYSLKYVRVMTKRNIVAMVAASWGIPTFLFAGRWVQSKYYHKLSVRGELILTICYTIMFEVIPTIILVTATSHILLISRRISVEMTKLLNQVRFNQSSSSVEMRAPKVGVRKSTVWLVIVVVAIFETCYGTEIYITICQTFQLCEVAVDTQSAFSVLLLANSALNPLVYAFLKQDIKRETKGLLCCRAVKTHCIK